MGLLQLTFPALLLALMSSKLQVTEASWNSLLGTWSDDEEGVWFGTLPPQGDSYWHFGPARLWTVPINSDSYVITSRVHTINGNGCGHVFKYKPGMVRTESTVTKAWGYMLSGGSALDICGSGTEYSPRFIHPFASEAWHTLKSVVEGTNVKIYMNDQLVTEVTLAGEEADSKTDNYVGLWCHARTLTRGDSFKVSRGDSEVCPQVSLYSGVAVSPSNCSEVDSPAGAVCAFSCPRGYRLIGPSSINCTGSGAWSDQSANATCDDVDECLTDNGGCSHSCTNVPGGYRCSCPDAELTLGADNHTCEAQGVNVSCAENDMSITLPKALFPGLDQNRLRLLNPSCQATATATHYILETPLIGCGTTRRHTDAAVVYSNAVLEMPDEFSIIRRTREFEIPFSCYYDNKGSVSSVGLKPTSTKLVFSQSGKGNFSLLLDMFPNETFTAPFSDGDFPISVLLGQRLYFQVAVTSEDQELSIIADKCYATPTQDIDAETKYELITDGCPSDATVQFHSPPSGHEQRFSLEAFEFIAENPFVFIHCDVKVCNATDPNSACTRACPARKRRHIGHGPSDVTEVYSLAQGPLVMEKGLESDEPAGDVPSSGVVAKAPQLLWLMLMMLTLLRAAR